MNSKIIFWESDALAFVGLPKTLQEKYNLCYNQNHDLLSRTD